MAIQINEEYANYLSRQYGPKVAERYKAVSLNYTPRPRAENRKVIENVLLLICAECGAEFIKKPAGSKKFCGRICAGKATRRNQLAKKLKKNEAKKK